MRFDELAKKILDNREDHIIDKDKRMEETLDIHLKQQAIINAKPLLEKEDLSEEDLEIEKAETIEDFYKNSKFKD